MKFSCSQCGKRFTTSEEPVPGRMYRVPCKCGNTIILQLDAAAVNVAPPPLPTAFRRRTGPPPLPRTISVTPRSRIVRPWPVQEVVASPPAPAPAAVPAAHEAATIADDPFARAAPATEAPPEAAHDEAVEVSAPRLARRDPDAPGDDSAELRLASSPLRRTSPRWITAAVSAARALSARAAEAWVAARWRARAAIAGAPGMAALVARASAPGRLRTPFARGVAIAAVLGGILIAAVARTSSPAAPHEDAGAIAPLPAHAAESRTVAPVSARSAPVAAVAARGRAAAAPAAAPDGSPAEPRTVAAVSAPSARASAAARAASPDAAPPDAPQREPATREETAAGNGEGEPARAPALEPALSADAEAGAPAATRSAPSAEPALTDTSADAAPEAPARAPAPLERPVLVAEAPPDAARSAAPAAAAEKPAAPPGAREILAALRERRADVEACIAEAPEEGPAALAGRRFRLVVVVDPGGTVSDARVDDPEIESTPVAACLSRIAQALSFAPFEGDPRSVPVPLRYRDAE